MNNKRQEIELEVLQNLMNEIKEMHSAYIIDHINRLINKKSKL